MSPLVLWITGYISNIILAPKLEFKPKPNDSANVEDSCPYTGEENLPLHPAYDTKKATKLITHKESYCRMSLAHLGETQRLTRAVASQYQSRKGETERKPPDFVRWAQPQKLS